MLIIGREGNTHPAFKIFAGYMLRWHQNLDVDRDEKLNVPNK